MQYDYDVIIIGGGPAGQQIAYGLAPKKRVLIVENELWGGTCPNHGCDPKKMLYGIVEAKRQADLFQGQGLKGDNAVVWSDMIDFAKRYTDGVPSGTEAGLRAANIHHNHGTAKFISQHAIDLEGEELSADKIIIATGAKAAIPNIIGSEYIETSNDFLHQKSQPKQIALIGAGYVAIELANIAISAGIDVHIFQHNQRILSGFPVEYAQIVADNLVDKGVAFHWDTDVSAISKTNTQLTVHTNQDDIAGFDHIYAAMGRPANVDALDLAAAGIDLADKGGIQVNDYLQTTAENIFAVGDVAASPVPKLTPVAGFEGRYVTQVILGATSKPISYPVIPQTVFAGPELAQVGVTIDQAQAHPDIYTVSTQKIGSWYTYNRIQDKTAQVTIITNQATGIIVGAIVLATNAEELINYLTAMIVQAQPASVLQNWIPVYPSVASDLSYFY